MYIMKRLLRSLLTLFIVVSVVFFLLRLMPVEGYFNNFDKVTETQMKVSLANMGLDKPIPVQLRNFWRQILQGDLGISNKYRVKYPIAKIIAGKMPLSLQIGGLAFITALALGLPLGILMSKSARSKSRLRLTDKTGTIFIVIIQGIPTAIYALFIMMLGTPLLRQWLSIPTLFKAANPGSWILPVFTLALGNLSMYAMWLRRYMVDEGNKDYITLARAKGVSPGRVSRSHIFRNAMVPLAQYFPTSVVLILMGSLYVESLYSIPGMGGLLVDVIRRQDNTMVQALVLIYSAMSIVAVMVGDILMAVLDPRISFSKKASKGAS